VDGVVAPDPSLTDWLLILGAGASNPPPTDLPTFAVLSSAPSGTRREASDETGGQHQGGRKAVVGTQVVWPVRPALR
jgi:hypothetical protein